MTVQEFEDRAKYQNGYDRQFFNWKIIDVHIIPAIFESRHEVDFYCSNGENVYLLRIRDRKDEFYVINNEGSLPYLIAEFPIEEIDDRVLNKVLGKFEILN